MFWTEHNPPHFHAKYGKHECSINIQTLTLIEGSLPPRAFGLVIEWAAQHTQELLENWKLVELQKPLNKIKPLQ